MTEIYLIALAGAVIGAFPFFILYCLKRVDCEEWQRDWRVMRGELSDERRAGSVMRQRAITAEQSLSTIHAQRSETSRKAAATVRARKA